MNIYSVGGEKDRDEVRMTGMRRKGHIGRKNDREDGRRTYRRGEVQTREEKDRKKGKKDKEENIWKEIKGNRRLEMRELQREIL
jgi:hypothetical protein